ncbi:hypothetical protein PMAYCL1PPCAC_00434 [Pristionchus mayeri]|uniref:TIL domain-containing protein n=1 Tax=Pristionchus mayeri TaxID=1317129 RepID=A0AAN4Z1J8_9BILA|nr:hypothetical protein PMAYCL1PPCAC_00433 [Pristionchus mayeri]GMR30239.1 hypothetical protein PMAYCL1PPCAC_00434 [Pristionchus mayeri]
MIRVIMFALLASAALVAVHCESSSEQSSEEAGSGHHRCKENQVYSVCSSFCVSKCGDYVPRPCPRVCGPSKCECERDFYLNSKGDCVTRAQCDAESD